MRLRNYLVFVFHLLLLHLLLLLLACLRVEGGLRLLEVLRILVYTWLHLRIGGLPADVVVEADVLAGFDFVDAVVVEVSHDILLLGPVVVIIWDVGHYQLCLLHHVHRPRDLLLKKGLPLLLGQCYLSVLVRGHGLLDLLVCLDLLDLLHVHLFSGQDLSLHLDVVHFLLLI